MESMKRRAACLVLACAVLQACGSTEQGPAHDAKPMSSAIDDLPGVDDLPDHCEPATGPAGDLLIDDFEDGDELLDESANLHGLWYVENDGSGEQSPVAGSERPRGALIAMPGAPDSPRHALHTSGGGFQEWGAFVGVKLNASRFQPCPYDISRYAGVRLSLKGSGSVRVNLGTVITTPVGDHGECEGELCSDFGATLAVGPDWSRVDLRFDELSQPDWATPADLEPARALRLSFWAEQDEFDFWIDDVRFYE
jgi:hypothetical protein